MILKSISSWYYWLIDGDIYADGDINADVHKGKITPFSIWWNDEWW